MIHVLGVFLVSHWHKYDLHLRKSLAPPHKCYTFDCVMQRMLNDMKTRRLNLPSLARNGTRLNMY